jgi:hypothetical protein
MQRPPKYTHGRRDKHAVDFGLSSEEIRKLRRLKTPWGIHRYLDSMPYHFAATAWSPRIVLKQNTAHCLEGAIFAAAALRANGYSPLILDLEAVQDTDHVLAVFKESGMWGAIAKSNFSGLRYREPVYRTIRELVLSYFETYFNLRGERTLRRYSAPVNLRRFDRMNWMVSEKPVWFIPEYLTKIRHFPLLKKGTVRRLHRIDTRSYEAGLVGHIREKKSSGPDKSIHQR